MMTYPRLILICSVLLTLTFQCHGYPNGAPPSACVSMMPGHSGVTPQVSPAPYTITVSSNTYNPSDVITVTITATNPSKPIRGFLLQARRADPNLDQTVPIGTFTAPDAKSKISCAGSTGNALTHTAAGTNSFSNLVVTWTAPSTAQGHVVFKATVAQVKTEYWIGIESERVSDPSAPNISPLPSTSPLPSISNKISTSGCDVSKGCLRIPSGCTSCDAIATWKDLGDGNVEIELARKGTGWVALGLSKDQSMGDDSVMECIHHSGTAVVSQSKNDGRSNMAISSPTDGLSNEEAGFIDGEVACKFQRKKLVSGRTGDIFDLQLNYYLLLARGSAISASSAGKMQHPTIPIVTSQKVDLSKTNAVDGSAVVAPSVKAHGSLMVIAWVITASFGVLMARHYKKQWPGTQIMGKDVWFMLHVPAMVITAIFTIIAFIIIFVHVKGYSDFSNVSPGILKAHPILGIIVTILAIINPIMGAFRPHPGTSKRPIFNWAHWGVGVTARILGTITIFLGLSLPSIKYTVPAYLTWVMVGFVAFYILVEVILEVYKCLDKGKGSSNIELKSPGEQGMSHEERSQESGQAFRNFMFAIIVIGLLAFGLAIVISIALT